MVVPVLSCYKESLPSPGKTLKMLGIYFELISLNELLSVFDIQKRDVYAAEAQFLKNHFSKQK